MPKGKLTDKQRKRWGAMNQVLYTARPLHLKEILESEPVFRSRSCAEELGEMNSDLSAHPSDLLDFDGWEYEEDEDGNWTYDPDD